MQERERLGSRLGFIMLSAGCAIGCGNVWKFPWMCGQNGGGSFMLLYILCLLVLGLPVMVMEFAVGRAAQASPIYMYQRLEKPGQRWGLFGVFSLIGNIALMAFYTVVTGWILYYFVKFLTGQNADFGFAQMLADPKVNVTYLFVVVVAAFVLLSFNLQGGLERLTKAMMTALLVLESGADLNESIPIPDSLTPEFQAIRANRGHTIGLQAGESVRRLDMLYAMLVPSANDAASVLASDAAGGDLAAFAARMNARASQLGCTNTHFICPHGLYDHNNYSTARDMAKIALACHANGTYMQVANTVSYTLPATNIHPARNISSTNRLLKPGSAYYRGYAQGMKTGFTTQAGRCFVTFASQNGRTYGLVILGSNSQNIFREAAELFDWAFSNPDLQPKAAAPETKKHSLFSFWQNLLG